MWDKRTLNHIIVAVIVAFAVVCIGLLIDILDDMHHEVEGLIQNIDQSRYEYNIWIPSDLDEKVVKSIYTSYDEQKLGVKFKITTLSADIYEETLITSGITNKLPDMFYINNKSVLTKLVDIGAIMDLSDYIKQKDVTKDFVEDAIEDFKVNNKIYGLPLMGWEAVLYCNTAIFEGCNINYPTSYEEFIGCIKAFKKQQIIPLSLGGESFTSSERYYWMLVEGNGSFEESAKALAQLVKISPFQVAYTTTKEDDAVSRFINGESAMFLGSSREAMRIEHSKESKIKEHIKVMPCPTTNKTGIRIGDYGCGFVLNANSDRNQEKEIKDYYESFERRLSWEMVMQRGEGLPVYKAQEIEKTRFKVLSRCNELMLENHHEGVYQKLLQRYESGDKLKDYKFQILRLMHGQSDVPSFLSSLGL